MGELGFCHLNDVFGAAATQLAGDIPADTGWPIILIRILHNKLIAGFILSLRCYFGYFDTQQVFGFISPFLLPFIVYSFWGVLWRKRIIILTLIFPVVFIFLLKPLEIGTKIYVFQGFYIFIAILGFVKMVKNIRNYLK